MKLPGLPSDVPTALNMALHALFVVGVGISFPGILLYMLEFGGAEGTNWNNRLGNAFARGKDYFTNVHSVHSVQVDEYTRHIVIMTFHTVAGACILLLGAVQYSLGRRGVRHRWLGRVYVGMHVINLLGSSLFLLINTGRDRIYTGPVFAFALMGQWLGATIFLLGAVVSARKRHIARHVHLITANYSIVVGAPLLRLAWIFFSHVCPSLHMDNINVASSAIGPVTVISLGPPLFLMLSRDARVRARQVLNNPIGLSRRWNMLWFLVASALTVLNVFTTLFLWSQTQLRGVGAGNILRSSTEDEIHFQSVWRSATHAHNFGATLLLLGFLACSLAPFLLLKELSCPAYGMLPSALRLRIDKVLYPVYLVGTLVGTVGVLFLLVPLDNLTAIRDANLHGFQVSFWVVQLIKWNFFAVLYIKRRRDGDRSEVRATGARDEIVEEAGSENNSPQGATENTREDAADANPQGRAGPQADTAREIAPRSHAPPWEMLLYSLVSSPVARLVLSLFWAVLNWAGVKADVAQAFGAYIDLFGQVWIPVVLIVWATCRTPLQPVEVQLAQRQSQTPQ